MFLATAIETLDHAWASVMHGMQSPFFNVFFKYFSVLAEHGLIILAISFLLFLFKKTRIQGSTIFFAVAISIVLGYLAKFVVARPRPFWDTQTDYYEWWLAAGADYSSSYSCPSGHACVAFAFATATLMTFDKRYGWTGFVFALVIGVARTYLMRHYLTDVLLGLVFGLVSGVLGYFAVAAMKSFIEKRPEGKFSNFLLNFDLKSVFEKKQ